METKERKNLTTNIVVLLMFCGTLIGSWQWNKYYQEKDSSIAKSVEIAPSDTFLVINGGVNLPSEKLFNEFGIRGTIITEKGVYGFKNIDAAKKIKGTIITSNGVISFDGTNSNGVFTPME